MCDCNENKIKLTKGSLISAESHPVTVESLPVTVLSCTHQEGRGGGGAGLRIWPPAPHPTPPTQHPTPNTLSASWTPAVSHTSRIQGGTQYTRTVLLTVHTHTHTHTHSFMCTRFEITLKYTWEKTSTNISFYVCTSAYTLYTARTTAQ